MTTYNDIKADLVDGRLLQTFFEGNKRVLDHFGLDPKDVYGFTTYNEFFNDTNIWEGLKNSLTKKQLEAVSIVYSEPTNGIVLDKLNVLSVNLIKGIDQYYLDQKDEEGYMKFQLFKDSMGIDTTDVIEEVTDEQNA